MVSKEAGNKVMLEASLSLENLPLKRRKEIASKLSLPENDQKDLLFMSAVLVSTGTNANGATFLGSELIRAKDSINQKPLNKEHDGVKIIGHISSSLYMTYEGTVLDENALYSELVEEDATEKTQVNTSLDDTDMDIGIICVVYKDSFPDIAEQISNDEWKVSMECYYEDFDLKIGNNILTKASLLAYKEKSTDDDVKKAIDEVTSGNKVSSFTISRVLRKIRFCGCAIVKNPAEQRAVILEAANHLTKTINRELMSEAVDVSTREAATKKSPFVEDSLEGEVVQTNADGYLLLKNGKLAEDAYFIDYNRAQLEAISRTAITKKAGEEADYSIVELNSTFSARDKVQINETSEAIIYKTGESANVKEIITIGEQKEEAELSIRKWGPKDNPAGICISFKKYKYEYPGGRFQGKIVATNWCQKYQKPCPVLGADATDPTCLRNVFGKAYETELDKVATNFNANTKLSHVELVDLYQQESPAVKDVDDGPNELTIPEDIEKADTDLVTATVPLKKEVQEKHSCIDLVDLVAKVTKEERSSLPSSCFGLPSRKQLPLHTQELITATMDFYPELSKSLKAFITRKELFNNIIYNALYLGVDTKGFENNSEFKFKAGREFSEEYGLPRLKLFPLGSREQVIAAMSRYKLMKAKVSEQEKEQLVINILRAAAKFSIDASRFRDRVRNK